jgi:hypothetical protein
MKSLADVYPELAKMSASSRNAAFEELRYVEDQIEGQTIGIEMFGVGSHYGDQSDLAVDSDDRPRKAKSWWAARALVTDEKRIRD